MAIRLQIRRDTEANWIETNPVLAQGEIIEVLPGSNEPARFKIGDGVTAYNNLPFIETSWGSITGTLSNQTDLQNALDGKVDELSSPATAGTYTKVTVNSDGLVSSGTTLSASDIPDISATYYLASNPDGYISGITSTDVTNALGYTPYNSSNPSGYISGITSTDVIEALGFTPYSDANPDGYISGITSSDVITALGYTPYDSSNPAGYTDNVGTVTSVNNVEPVNGNVTIEIPDISGKVDKLETPPTAGTYTKVTINSDGLVSSGTTLSASDIPSLTLSKISDVTASASEVNILDGATLTTTELNYVDGVTSNIQTQLNGKLSPSDIINNVQSTDTDKPLSANMGKELQDQVDNLKARGRFLALWDCSTGLAETHPTESPYLYQTGDYFIVGIVAQAGGTNYKPSGSSYTDNVPSTAVETVAVSVDDVYYYDGNVWHLQINTQKEIAFVNIAGDPYDNSNLASALNNKQDELPSQTGQSGKFLKTNGSTISWGDAPVTDVQVGGSSVVNNGVANISNMVTTNTAQNITAKKTFSTSTWNGGLTAKRTTTGGCYINCENSNGSLGVIGIHQNEIPLFIDKDNTEPRAVVRAGIYLSSTGNDASVGDTSTPVYIDTDGIAQECTGVQEKVTVTTISSNDSITLADNTCFKGGSISAFTITVPSSTIYPFVCEIDFTSPSTATTITYSGTIVWAEGSDDITSNVFVPVASKEYTIMIWNNGTSYAGIAKGV